MGDLRRKLQSKPWWATRPIIFRRIKDEENFFKHCRFEEIELLLNLQINQWNTFSEKQLSHVWTLGRDSDIRGYSRILEEWTNNKKQIYFSIIWVEAVSLKTPVNAKKISCIEELSDQQTYQQTDIAGCGL